MTIVIVSSVVLLSIILFLIFRTQILLGILKGSSNNPEGLSNKVNALLFPILFIIGMTAFVYYSLEAKKFLLPESASEHGLITDRDFWISMLIIIIPFFGTSFLLFWFPFKYQYDKNRRATFYPENHKLELIWTVIPAIVLTFLVIEGYKSWSNITSEAPKEAQIIEIMGKQFAWQVRYPGKDNALGNYNFKLIDSQNEFGLDFRDKASYDDFIPRELHIPKGQPVLLKIRARDVLHSVFMPHFRLKMDAVPGMPTKFWFVPRTSTQEMREKLNNPEFNYELACTEVCGRGHFAMKFIVVVDEPEDYVKWCASQDSWIKQNPDYLKVFREKTFITENEKKPVIDKTISLN